MTVATLDLAIRKGDSVVQPVVVTTGGVLVPLPVGTKGKMQIRSTPQSNIVLAELSSDNSRITVDPATAEVSITVPSAVTAAFTFERAVFDLRLIYPDNEEETIVAGKVYVLPSVTRS